MDSDNELDETAVWLRRKLMQEVRQTPDPLNQMLMEIEQMGEPFNLGITLDYNPDTSDIEERPF